MTERRKVKENVILIPNSEYKQKSATYSIHRHHYTNHTSCKRMKHVPFVSVCVCVYRIETIAICVARTSAQIKEKFRIIDQQ